MPQLDIYILWDLIHYVLLFWCLLFILNLSFLLINVFLSLRIIKLKYFIEKQLLKKIFKELYFLKNIKFFKNIILLIKNSFLNIKNKYFIEKLLDIYSINLNIYIKILKKKIKNKILSKNNLEIYRNVSGIRTV